MQCSTFTFVNKRHTALLSTLAAYVLNSEGRTSLPSPVQMLGGRVPRYPVIYTPMISVLDFSSKILERLFLDLIQPHILSFITELQSIPVS